MPLAASGADTLRWIDDASDEIPMLHAVRVIDGVWITSVSGRNDQGTGHIRSHVNGQYLTWQAPGSSNAGPQVHCGGDGAYLLYDGDDDNCWVRVQVDASELLPSPQDSQVYMAEIYDNALCPDDFDAAEAAGAASETNTIYLQNDGDAAVHQVAMWIDGDSHNTVVIRIGGAWVSPTDEASAEVVAETIAPGANVSVTVRVAITAASPSDDDALCKLHCVFQALG